MEATPAPAKKKWYKRKSVIITAAVLSVVGMVSNAGAKNNPADAGTAAPVVTEAPAITEAPATIPATTEAPPITEAPVVSEAPVVDTVPPVVEAPVATEAPAPVPVVETFVVTNVVDGDTVDLDNGERVRLVGIDTPEQGQCGADEATMVTASLTLNKTVTLEPSDEDRDRYGRLLRYVVVDGVDVGGQLLAQGYAIPRYNSTDGYGLHPREAEYAAIAQPSTVVCTPATTVPAPSTPPVVTPAPKSRPASNNVFYKNCDAVRAAGAAPIYPGDPGFQQKFDRDNDGVGCE